MTELSKSRQSFPTGTPKSLTVVAWPDQVTEARGHKPGTAYVEAVWLGVIGPSTTLAWSRLSRIAIGRPGTVIDTADLALSLGLGSKLGKNDSMTRTLTRMVMFGAAARQGDTLAVRRALPDVPSHFVGRLSYTARLAHQRWAVDHTARLDQDLNPPLDVSRPYSVEVGL